MSALKQTQPNANQTNQRFWNIVWRAAFMILGDEDKAEKIANESINPSAVKDDVIVPDDVSAPNRETWVCVYKAACDNCEEDQAKTIANEVCAKCDASAIEGTKSVIDKNTSYSFNVEDNRLILQKNGGTIKLSRSIKSESSPEEGWVEGYLVSWGSTKDTDLQGEFFSPRTEFCLDWFGERPVLYHHGMDDSTGLKKIGVFKTIKVDNIGLWVQAQLDLRDRYARAVYDMVAAKQFGWSSGSVDHLVKIGENGEILVWPLIEGSITPTPAQPAKTAVRPIKASVETGNQFMTMQAFKAVLSDDVNSSEYLRGLDEHISSADVSELLRRASARVATQKTIATRTKNNNGFKEGDSISMARNTESAWYITRAVAKAFGIKDATAEEMNAVASEVQGVVQDEVDAAAAQALEDEAKAAEAEVQASATASYNRNRQLRGQAMRQVQAPPAETTAQVDPNAPVASYSTRQVGAPIPVAPATMQDLEQLESTAQDPNNPATASYSRRAMRQVAPAQTPANTIEAAMMNEFAAQMEDEQMEQKAARALRQRAWKRAMRQITDMPADSTMQDDAQLADEEMIAQYDTTGSSPVSPGPVEPGSTADGMTIASYNQARARRNFSTRQVGLPATQQDPNAPIAQIQDPVMAAMMADAEDDADKADDESTMQEQIISDVATASYRRGYRSGLRSAYRQVDPNAVAQDEQLAQAADAEVNEEVASLSDQGADDDVVAQAARAYRAGYRKGLRRAVRQLEQDVDSDKADEESAETSKQASIVPDGTLSYGARGYVDPRQAQRNAQYRAQMAQRGYGYRQVGDPNAPIMQDPYAGMQDPETIAQYPTMQDPYAGMQDPYAGMQDQFAGMQDPETIAQYSMMQDPYAGMQDQVLAPQDTIAQYDTTTTTPVSPATMQMQDPSILPAGSVASYSGRGQRVQYPGYASQRGYGYRQLDPSMPVDPSAAMQDQMIADQMSGAQMAEIMDSTAQYSQLSDDQTISGVTPVRNYNPQAFRSANFDGGAAYEAQRQAEYWKQRANQLETMEAGNQRAFKSLGVNSVKDVADRPGAYPAAFKSYLMKGLGLMTDTEKYILTGKGKARWENASFSYDTATKSVKTYSSGSDASVGFLVPEDWVNELNTNVMTQTVMAPECKTRTTTSDRIVQPNLNTTDARRAHPAQVRWPGESPASNTDHRTVEDEYTQVTIPIHVMLITLAATNSALEDATFNLEEEINEAFAEAVAVSYDQLIWGGDGQGKLQGIVTNTQVTGSPSLGMKTVGGYVATGSADGIVTADTLKTMLFHLPQGYRQRAKWYMNSNTGLQISTLKDGMGNYLIDQRDDALRTVGVPDRLLNHPIVYNEWADDADSGNFPVVLADLTKGYIIGRRVEFSIRRFDDSNYAEHDQVLFLGRARLGGQVLQPAAFKTLKVALS